MGRPRKGYICRFCSHKASGPGPLGQHYKDHPSHKPKHLSYGKRSVENWKRQVEVDTNPMSSSALDLFLDDPSHVLDFIDGKVLQLQEIVGNANEQILEANKKIRRLSELRGVLGKDSDHPKKLRLVKKETKVVAKKRKLNPLQLKTMQQNVAKARAKRLEKLAAEANRKKEVEREAERILGRYNTTSEEIVNG